MKPKPQHLFFIGIVGHAMRGIALAAIRQGHVVTGLDESVAEGDAGAAWVDAHGIDWSRTPQPSQLDGVDLVIISGGTSADYPMVLEAERRHIPVQSFAEYLGELTRSKHVISVAGTHGKTTTTSLITWLLESAGRHPDYLIGIRPFNFDSSARLDDADTFVVEGDEYKASSLDPHPKLSYYHPDTLVLTSVEHDHPDVYPTMKDYVAAFEQVVGHLPKTGRLVACADSATVMNIAAKANCDVITYGLDQGEFTARHIAYEPAGISYNVVKNGEPIGRLTVGVYGRHNVLNSLAATAVALSEGLTWEQIQAGAATFKGAYRRTNLLTPVDSPVLVVDDYAHHPTEAEAMIRMMKLHFPDRRLLVVYRPHTYSRTQTLLSEYHQAFSGADHLYLTDVEPAREAANQRTVSGQEILDGLPPKLKANSVFEPDRDRLIARLKSDAKPGDMVLCMTVSGYGKLAEELAAAFSPKH